jgi:hypothetical protein
VNRDADGRRADASLLFARLFQFRRPAFQREFANIAPNDSDQSCRQQERRRQECDEAVGDKPMGQAPPHRQNGRLSPIRRDIEKTDADEADVGALMKENAELRQLVIQLSKLVIKNVILHK